VLVSGGGKEDKTVIVWQVEQGKPKVQHKMLGHLDEVRSLSLSPDDRFIVSGSFDRTLGVWDVGAGQMMRVLEGSTNWFYSVAWLRDGTYMVSWTEDKTVRVWEPEEQVCAPPLRLFSSMHTLVYMKACFCTICTSFPQTVQDLCVYVCM
jgi:WD40 repeat protein